MHVLSLLGLPLVRRKCRRLGFRVWGLGFGVWGLGFRVCGLGFRVWGLGFRVGGLGFRAWGLGLRVGGNLMNTEPSSTLSRDLENSQP